MIDVAKTTARIRGKLNGLVYQGTSKLFANAPTGLDTRRQIRIEPEKVDPKTPAQLAQRAKVIAANEAWAELSEEDNFIYNRIAAKTLRRRRDGGLGRYFSGFGLFISRHVKGEL